MAIIRVVKSEKYFTASNEPFLDNRLSWESRGLMGYLLTKPNNWEIRQEDIESQGPAGNFKVRRMLAELRQFGYMNRVRVTLEHNKFDWRTDVFESPSQNPNPSKQIVKVASGGFPTSGSPTSGSSTSGKPPDIVIPESPSTESLITEDRDTRAQEIFKELETLSGALNSMTPGYVDTWLEKHTNEWIVKAITEAKSRGARSIKYIDQILVGWEANGYPKSRDERVDAARGDGKEPANTSGESLWGDLFPTDDSLIPSKELQPLEKALQNKNISIGKCAECGKEHTEVVNIKDGKLCFICFDGWRQKQLGLVKQ